MTTVHIYYPIRDRLAADLLRDLIKQEWPGAECGDLIDHLSDGHPLPHFRTELDSPADQIADWLKHRCGRLDIRITENGRSIWLGRTLYR